MRSYFLLDDLFIGVSVIALAGLSLVVINNIASGYFFAQAVFFLVGLAIGQIFSAVDLVIYKKAKWIIYGVIIFLLILSFFGPVVRGSTRWIGIGERLIQPSEILKPFFVLFFASLATSKNKSILKYFPGRILLFLPVFFLVLKQPDLGNAIVYLIVFFTVEIMAGLRTKNLILSFIFVLILMPVIFFLMHDYQKARIVTFLNPESDPQGAGYNAAQSVIAVGSGQLFGMGLGRGTQSGLAFLPEYHTDFVFASLVEQLGFIGGGMALIFYFLLIMRMVLGSFRTKNSFLRSSGAGIAALIFFQVFINTGMNLGVMPITGITLPFLSYGGSSILGLFISLGIYFSILREIKRRTLVID